MHFLERFADLYHNAFVHLSAVMRFEIEMKCPWYSVQLRSLCVRANANRVFVACAYVPTMVHNQRAFIFYIFLRFAHTMQHSNTILPKYNHKCGDGNVCLDVLFV